MYEIKDTHANKIIGTTDDPKVVLGALFLGYEVTKESHPTTDALLNEKRS